MKDTLQFILGDFWVFAGFVVILELILSFLFRAWNRFWRHMNIRKHGYPPSYCDADGDFKQE